MQQPATVNPNDLFINPGPSYTAQGYSSSAYQTAGYADPNCTVTKAEQRDMDRHYRSAHKAYAASKGILTEEATCGIGGCTSKFTRRDNLRKHWKKYHGYEQPEQ
ncbi:hypothetical protein NW762_000029 [Fusarium torreyae]|uniref:C2H2-type domain-containing protein n=1 Tax=Fusarium torreyae TaxID=1237075 RepID=A0A9W8VN04_9HYPO|nr:hypothetical protein NW762_000029 [Fusarium torreyae]